MQYNQMKLFEIPYNFDINLINFLKLYQKNIFIHCIYCCPYYQDYQAAKHYDIIHNDLPTQFDLWFIPRDEYENQIKYINKLFPNKLMLLLQQKSNILMDKNKLQYYINLGFKIFCVGSIEQAQLIQEIDSTLEIVGSITMQLTLDNYYQMEKKYQNLFDAFVLYFPFNRNLQMIKQLPKCFKYSLLVSSFCYHNCNGTKHWLASSLEELREIQCPRWKNIETNKKENIEDLIMIRPQDLKLFENDISYFKLVGRELSTQDLIRDIVLYSTDLNIYYINDNIDVNKLYNIKEEQ